MSSKKLRVVELFAGVGGFRLGLEKHNNYKIVWSNQWEPSTNIQHASMVYQERFGSKNHSNQDISTIDVNDIPDCDLLVGGFPCQDYSIANNPSHSKGIDGKKGVLWWSIHKIVKHKKPKYLFLENVDRLLKSLATQRGRDFSVMLQSLNELGYAVEWRVVNAAEYGMSQRRKRLFFLAYHQSTKIYKRLVKSNKTDWLLSIGTIANAFPAKNEKDGYCSTFELNSDLSEISNNFNKGGKPSPYLNTGLMVNGEIHTIKTKPIYGGKKVVLKDILEKREIPSEFFIDKKDLKKWSYLKGAKVKDRISKDGIAYKFREGNTTFPDALDKPSRTIITSEGSTSPSRFTHAVDTTRGIRRLTPVELERLNMFPDNHTQLKGVSNIKRGFLMGNALVVGVVEKIGKELFKQANK